MAYVDPMHVRFTHASISPCFRNGDHLDKMIENALANGVQVMKNFPPMELVCLSSVITL